MGGKLAVSSTDMDLGPKKIFLQSLGCPKNLVDSEVMLGVLRRRGFEVARSEEEAQVIVVNTCSFISSAKQESIDTILNLSRLKQEGVCEKLVVTGCLPQNFRNDDIHAALPEVDRFLGTGEFAKIADVLDELYGGQLAAAPIGDPEATFEAFSERVRSGPVFSSYLKIAEGCNRTCSFCIIPQLRGVQRSRDIRDIVAEAERLSLGGCREINLIAQDLTSYGEDLPGRPRLTELLRELIQINGIEWIRLMYNYPDKFTPDLVDLVGSERKIVHYLDMPIQHADDTVLKHMRRNTREKVVRDLLTRLRREIPDLVLRTTFIVGFPGETDEQFEKLIDFVEEYQFDRMGAFTYSREENTPAGQMSGQLTESIKKRRLARLMRVQQRIARDRSRSLIGKTLNVLVEGPHPESEHLMTGRTEGMAPDIDGCVHIAGIQSREYGEVIQEIPREKFVGRIVPVKITDADVYDLVGEILV